MKKLSNIPGLSICPSRRNETKRKLKISLFLIVMLLLLIINAFGQRPHRVGTTAANFLEIGVGSDGNAMGEAYVSIGGNLSSIYWNPAGLAYLDQNEAMFMHQPWIVDIKSMAAALAYRLPNIGILSFGFTHLDYGDMDVTSLEMQNGTGETFTVNDYCFSMGFSRKLAQWFAFGASVKYISSIIWHSGASAYALDLGVIVNTGLFSISGAMKDGLNIGMSISNYGTKMKYDGIDLIQPIDIAPNQAGNFSSVPGLFRMQEWELPLIFRIGASINPVSLKNQRITLSADALHPNNNGESINLGFQYAIDLLGTGTLFFRTGYKALLMDDSEYGLTLGGGLLIRFMNNLGIKMDYAYKPLGILGNTHCYTIGIMF